MDAFHSILCKAEERNPEVENNWRSYSELLSERQGDSKYEKKLRDIDKRMGSAIYRYSDFQKHRRDWLF